MQLIFALLVSTLCLFTISSAEYPSKYRMAYHELRGSFPTDYLRRLQMAGYTHVIANVGIGSNLTLYQDTHRDLFLAAAREGLRFVPSINTYSRYSRDYANYPGVSTEWNRQRDSGILAEVPSLSSDTSFGIDDEFLGLVYRIRSAFDSAKATPGSNITWSQEFINIGGDEMISFGLGTRGSPTLLVGDGDSVFSGRDRSELQALRTLRNGDASKAMQEYIARAYFRKAVIVKNVFGAACKTLVYADMWDKTHNGLPTYSTGAFGGSRIDIRLAEAWVPVSGEEGMVSLPGFSDSEKNTFNDQMILVPWHYQIFHEPTFDNAVVPMMYRYLTKSYSSSNAARRTNFKVIWAAAISNYHNPQRMDNSWWISTFNANNYFITASGEADILPHIQGYMTLVFGDWSNIPGNSQAIWDPSRTMYNQHFAFDIIEFVANRTRFPKAGY